VARLYIPGRTAGAYNTSPGLLTGFRGGIGAGKLGEKITAEGLTSA